MAKLALDLSQFQSAGVYTIEIDQSERITVTTQSLRLVAGFSKVGPFNAPVFIRSTRDRYRFYADTDKKLERKGSFFQRGIDTCLLQAPVFAISLLNVGADPSTESVGFADLSVACDVSNNGVYTDPYINFFNRERFWKADSDYLLGVAGNKEGVPNAESTSLLQVANVGTRDLSVIVRKAVGLQGYSVAAKDWYGSNTNIPFEWIRPYDLLKDYFIQVIAIEGRWTNYKSLSTDPFFSTYFNAEGIIPSQLQAFINLPQVNLIGSWIGTIIPDFRDQTGANQYIEDIINSSTPITGVLANVNQQALDQLIWDENQSEWEIGDGSATDAAKYTVDLVGHGLINEGVTAVGVPFNHFDTPAIFTTNTSTYFLDASALIPADVSLFISPATFDASITYITLNASVYVSPAVVQNVAYFDASGNTVDVSVFVSPAVVQNSSLYGVAGVNIKSDFLSYDLNVPNDIMHTTIPIMSLLDTTGKTFKMGPAQQALITIGTLIKKDPSASTTGGGVAYVISKVTDTSMNYIIGTSEPIWAYTQNASEVYVQKPIDDVTPQYKFLMLQGLKLTANHLPGYSKTGQPNVEEGIIKIYSMLEDQGILRGLTNPDMINYRYVVDTMGYGLRPNCGGKVYLSRLAKKRGKTTAIISAPSLTQFATSQDPYFCDVFIPGVDPKPIFNTAFIPQGGNPEMPRSFQFTLPDEDNGAKFTGVFGPFLSMTDSDTTVLVPPAADISNSFVRKFLGGDPFAIVANKNGIISNPALAGVEYMLDQQDRNYLEPFGYNSIVERTATGEIMIYSNRTAFQTIKSDYNYLHVRELLNTIELQVEEVLKNFVFNYNNAVTRLTIVNAITPILQSIKDAGALSQYEIVMDETNNTPDIIDEAFAIIDIGVWVTKGMEKIIQRITVNKTGGASSGGFTTA
jgi:hypothetical protein